MSDVKSIVAHFGRKRIAGQVDRSENAVGLAVADGLFPSSWFPFIRDLCAEDGLSCPEQLFRWADSRKKPDEQKEEAGVSV